MCVCVCVCVHFNKGAFVAGDVGGLRKQRNFLPRKRASLFLIVRVGGRFCF